MSISFVQCSGYCECQAEWEGGVGLNGIQGMAGTRATAYTWHIGADATEGHWACTLLLMTNEVVHFIEANA